jgi:hypothetical protein
MSDIELHVTIKITNKEEFKESAVDYGCKTDDALADMVKKIAIEPDEEPSKHGYKIASVDVTSASDENHTVIVGIDIENEEAMINEVRSCFSAAWQDEEWKPDTLGQAAFELLCGSNERPSPDTLGFEYTDWTYPKDRAVNPEYLLDNNDDNEDDLEIAPGM